MKRVLICGLIGLTLFTTGCGCSKKDGKKDIEEKEPEVNVNVNEDVIKDQEFEGLQMTNTALTTVDGISTLLTEVYNGTGVDYELNQFWIIVKNEAGDVIARIPGYVGEVIRNGETRTINSSTDIDLTEAVSIEYSVEK